MKRFIKKLTRSLTGRLALLFIFVHFITVIGLSVFQKVNYRNEVRSQEIPLYSVIYSLRGAIDINPELSLKDLNEIDDSADAPIKIWADIVRNNPNLWYYLDKDDQVSSLGQAPVFLPTLSKSQRPLPELDGVCLSGSSESYHDGYSVFVGYEDCATGSFKYELGGIETDYNMPENPWLYLDFNQVYWLWPALISYIGLIFLMPLLIYGLVSPIRRASNAALRISPYSSRKTLPVEGMLSEVKGLADATNKALQRLDAGYVRERWLRDVLAHELRTPLTVMRGHLEDVENPTLQKRLVDDLYRTNRVLERITNFSIATSLTSAPEALNLVEVVRAACAEAGSYGDRHNVEINMITQSDDPVLVKINRIALMLILTNLIGNAIRHSGASEAVDVEVCPQGEVQIRDYGKGMDIAALNKFFNNFSKLDDRLVQRKGLGLIIVAELTEFSASKISAFETRGGGLGFSLQVPIID